MVQIIRKYGIIIRALLVAIPIVILKIWVDSFHWSFIEFNPVIGAFLSGVFFTISILFAGAVADYKEAEKIPGELAVSFKSLMADSLLIPNSKQTSNIILDLQKYIKELLFAINSNFLKESWKLKEIDMVMKKINVTIIKLNELGVPLGIITKMRSELTVIDRLSHRVDIIEETSFIPAAYGIAEVAVITTIGLLIFIINIWSYGGWLVVGLVSLVLISLVFLIKDIDNPFEYESNSYADIDISILLNLEKYWRKSTIQN